MSVSYILVSALASTSPTTLSTTYIDVVIGISNPDDPSERNTLSLGFLVEAGVAAAALGAPPLPQPPLVAVFFAAADPQQVEGLLC